jgi:AmmeMemoRadiSam system protein B
MKPGVYGIMLLVFLLPATAGCNDRKAINIQNRDGLFIAGDTLVNRKPAVAGSFYPGTRDALRQQLEQLFSAATPNKQLGNVVAVISPHAGYFYSGSVAASAFNQLAPDFRYDNIFIIATSHHTSFEGAAIYCEGNFITPIGIARVNIPLARKLVNENPEVFRSYPDAHRPEHSIEVQIPFLQHLYKDDLQIIPVLLGTYKSSTCKLVAEALRPFLNGKNLFVISTDFSHYPDYQNACAVDKLTAEAIIKNSPGKFLAALENNENQAIPGLATSICGWTSMLTFLDITEKMPGIQYHLVQYRNSGDSPEQDKDRGVGYNAIAVTLDQQASANRSGSVYSLSSGE